MNFIVIIPARFASHRLPGKPLADINGKPMVIHALEQARQSGAKRVIVATDHIDIANIVKLFGGEVCITHSKHHSGTERIQEVVEYYGFNDNQIIVNIQVDELFIPPTIIQYVVNDLINDVNISMSTVSVPILNKDEIFNSDIVKVVVNIYGNALYFSRAGIPKYTKEFNYDDKHDHYMKYMLRHIGIYAYRVNFIQRYANWTPSPLEKIEMLEQLRVLWYNEKIHVVQVNLPINISINTPEELIRARILK